MAAGTGRFTDKDLDKAVYRANGKDRIKFTPRNAYYTLLGWHDRIDDNGHPRVDKGEDFLAHTWKHGIYQNYQVAVDEDNNLYQAKPNKVPSGYVLTNSSTFNFYLKYLASCDSKYLTIAECERQARTTR